MPQGMRIAEPKETRPMKRQGLQLSGRVGQTTLGLQISPNSKGAIWLAAQVRQYREISASGDIMAGQFVRPGQEISVQPVVGKHGIEVQVWVKSL